MVSPEHPPHGRIDAPDPGLPADRARWKRYRNARRTVPRGFAELEEAEAAEAAEAAEGEEGEEGEAPSAEAAEAADESSESEE